MKKITFIFTFLLLLNGIYTSAQYTKIHDFSGNTEGFNPFSNLFFDGTYLYGVTPLGGLYNNGTIFKLKPDGTEFSKIFDFNAFISGYYAYSTLISDGTFLYGTTKGDSGANTFGTVYKIKPDGSEFSTLHNFSGFLNGSGPWGGLYLIGDFLYGMTAYGNTIFKIKTDGSNFSTIFYFSQMTSGSFPQGEFIYDGMFLYGTTGSGGINNRGTVFKILPDGTGYLKLVDFNIAPNGSFPRTALIFDGTFLYGTTGNGGVNDFGSIFKVKPDGTEYQQIFSFSGVNGHQPMDLVQLGDYLYGTTTYGGTNDIGTIFRIKPDGSEFSKLLDFNGAAYGTRPIRSLIKVGTILYGMTSSGGIYNSGVIYKYVPENLSVSDTSIKDCEIKFYPNPSNGIFTIGNCSSNQIQIEVYNVIGEVIYQLTTINQNEIIDLSKYSKGIYFVKVKDLEKNVTNKKILIQ